ncbi:hypothetical protein FLAG1_10039 [Fusarium langsethiae]|uniref:2EXR domain-containing protein n=1 Tax=Fusarium langsethiae TaxID=179993 RepID=A0A0M9EPW0_FUSLA|nr:hypothetical protein FLAG1_10039 [Fusarium langsethiae]GKU12973.1 unnamed protein product [Fusarium langsethiae]
MPVLVKDTPFELGNLPAELRLMIWEAMFPKTRIHGVIAIQGSEYWKYTFRITPFSLPMVFQICSESRQIAQARFKRFAINKGTELADCWVPYGYCNPKVDALYVPFRALGTGGALEFGPFRRIMIAVNSPGSSYPMHPCPNSGFATKNVDDRLQICFVKAGHTIEPPDHGRCNSVFPVGLPEPKPLTRAGWPFYKATTTWISEMERCVEDGYGPAVTVGLMPPISCAYSGRFEEMKVAFEAEQAEKADGPGNAKTEVELERGVPEEDVAMSSQRWDGGQEPAYMV